MPRQFYPATAEQLLSVIGALVAKNDSADVSFIAQFCDIPEARAEKALDLAVDLGFLRKKTTKYSIESPLCRFLRSPDPKQKAAALRILLDSYEPYVSFRHAIIATGLAETAAQQTKLLFDFDAHREDIKETLISLATYSGALSAQSGGAYQPDSVPIVATFEILADACADIAGAEAKIRNLLGPAETQTSRPNVLLPLAQGLLFAVAGSSREAVVNAGNAVESFLIEYAQRANVDLTGATGINSKIDRLKSGGKLPTKYAFKGKYLGHVRNAADHGVDAEINAPWQIRRSTGEDYVMVACSFIATVYASENNVFEI